MKNSFLEKRNLIILCCFFGLSAFLWWIEPSSLSGAKGRWFSLIPALLVVFTTLITRGLFLGLLLSIFLGSLLGGAALDIGSASAWSLSTGKFFGYFTDTILDTTNLQILAFISFLLPSIHLMMKSGAMYGVIHPITKFISSSRRAQGMTVFMGLVVFIDDYANTMIVGNAMRPITDKFKVSREKLAFLVDATSAPIAGVALISTWVGYEVSLFSQIGKDLGVDIGGYDIFLSALNYRFYCYFMIIFVVLIVIFGRDFGPMAKAEERCLEKDLDVTKAKSQDTSESGILANARVSAWGAIVPMFLLFSFFLVGVWQDGGGGSLDVTGLGYFSFSNWQKVFSNSENNILILAQAAVLCFTAAVVFALALAKLSFKNTCLSLLSGLKTTMFPAAILILAWSLKAVCKDLETGGFLISVTKDIMSPEWLPFIVFLLAGIVAFTTGTSWGTMAILIPMVAPLAFHYDGGALGVISIMSLAAVLDGAIFGDHCSPISDTTIMSSMATGCDHLEHVRTQLPYAMMVAAVALLLGYLPGSFLGWGIGYSATGAVLVLSLCILVFGKKKTLSSK